MQKFQEYPILLSALSGSHAYGLNTPQSDTDIRGVFVLPQKDLYGLYHKEQLNDNKNDIIYYELGRYIGFLLKNNPNILELLAVSEDCILERHPIMNHLKPAMFLSKLCNATFAGYAREQIKKAWSLNKKILNPMEEERKSILAFCYIVIGHGSVSLGDWLQHKGWNQADCGLVNIANMKDVYALFHLSQFEEEVHFNGIINSDSSQDVCLSSIPKGHAPIAILHYNKDGYSAYCKQYFEYWDWVQKRNQHRYENTIEHGKQYDTKNMMHTFRLLNMAEEIARDNQINVRRTHDIEFLWKIRKGEYYYKELVALAETKLSTIDALFEKSSLPDKPDESMANQILITMREELYQINK